MKRSIFSYFNAQIEIFGDLIGLFLDLILRSTLISLITCRQIGFAKQRIDIKKDFLGLNFYCFFFNFKPY